MASTKLGFRRLPGQTVLGKSSRAAGVGNNPCLAINDRLPVPARSPLRSPPLCSVLGVGNNPCISAQTFWLSGLIASRRLLSPFLPLRAFASPANDSGVVRAGRNNSSALNHNLWLRFFFCFRFSINDRNFRIWFRIGCCLRWFRFPLYCLHQFQSLFGRLLMLICHRAIFSPAKIISCATCR